MTDDGWDPDETVPHTDDDVPWDLITDPWTAPAPAPAPDDDEPEERASSWQPVNLADLFASDYDPPTPTMFRRSDGQPVIYPGMAHVFAGAPESGKSWAALAACVQAISDGLFAIYIDFEDTAATVVARLIALGATPEQVVARLTYLSPSEPIWWDRKLTRAGIDFGELLDNHLYDLAIIDGVTEAMTIHGFDINSNTDAATYYAILPRRLQRTGAATVQIDHKPKNSRDNPTRGGIGAQHKLAGVDVMYRFDVVAPFGVGQHGIAKVTIEKDRHGQLRQHAAGPSHDKIAELHLKPEGDRLSATLEPVFHKGGPPTFEPTRYMERVSAYVAECNNNDNHPSQRDIEAGVTGKAEHIREAIAALIRHGNIVRGAAGHRANEHTLVNPYTAPDDDDG